MFGQFTPLLSFTSVHYGNVGEGLNQPGKDGNIEKNGVL